MASSNLLRIKDLYEGLPFNEKLVFLSTVEQYRTLKVGLIENNVYKWTSPLLDKPTVYVSGWGNMYQNRTHRKIKHTEPDTLFKALYMFLYGENLDPSTVSSMPLRCDPNLVEFYSRRNVSKHLLTHSAYFTVKLVDLSLTQMPKISGPLLEGGIVEDELVSQPGILFEGSST
jgi:hypothetical protein